MVCIRAELAAGPAGMDTFYGIVFFASGINSHLLLDSQTLRGGPLGGLSERECKRGDMQAP